MRPALLYMCVIGLYVTAAPVGGVEDKTALLHFGMHVPPIVRWAALDAHAAGATLSIRAGSARGAREATHAFRLLMNVDVVIRADVTPYRNRLDSNDELETRWRILDDARGDPSRTGVSTSDAVAASGYATFVPAAQFLPAGLRVTHAPTDGAVNLSVTAEANPPASGQGIYDAHVMLTALPQTWRATRGPRRYRSAAPREWR